MPSKNTAYSAMLLQIYKSISEKQKKLHKSYTLRLLMLWVSSLGDISRDYANIF